MQNLRALTGLLLSEVLDNGRSLSNVLPEFKKQCKDPRDAALLQALSFGVLRFYLPLSFIANALMTKPLKHKEKIVLYLICIGLYQLRQMRIPAHAAISETVEATKQLNKPWASGLVNAVLRSYQRQSIHLEASLKNNKEAYYAHPEWLIDTIKQAYPTQWQTILKENNEVPPLVIRVNLLKNSRETYLQILAENNIQASKVTNTNAALLLDDALDVPLLPGYQEGRFCVQDAAAQFAPTLLQLAPKLRVLDACAAPGGKTTHILEAEPHLAEVLAIDIAEERTDLIAENLKRLQLSAKVITADILDKNAWWDKIPFDRILLDAPCSSTGVIRRHPDIKYLRQSTDMEALAEKQIALLKVLWPMLKPGGILVYATCSILPEENEQVIEKFLSLRTDAKIFPFSLPVGTAQKIGYQILPGENNMDGFYYACLEKIKTP